MAGDALIYTADDRNVHSVDEVMDGERLTLTLWFTRDSSYDEDAKLVALLSQISLDSQNNTCVPFPASNHMYWYSPDPASQYGVNGFDVRWARLHILGYSLYSDHDRIQKSRSNSSIDPLDLLNQPMRLGRDGKVFEMKFHNNLHALQVVLFYCWKVSDLKSSKGIEEDIQTTLQQSSHEEVSDLNTVLHFDSQLVEAFFCEDRFTFDWNDFSIVIAAWEEYVHRLRKELMSRIPQWRLGNQLC
ncbi:hypothetical protein QJS10_CPA06g02320 [Acorus calamus]|uniref:Prolyl 4-hydroxylase alpha subunit Fe(2+) 2OG dioxygenase domain-containing protein n=1 Tax=Acorus calamus TaxID=4465 RepID=A0AAV9EIW3_ACOCL|nr:hypothetical protein QJS10_CPA06g02320 [Acorus calamus]